MTPPALHRPLVVVVLAGPDLRDARCPVAEGTARVPAGAKRRLQIRREITRLGDELRRDPYSVAVSRGGPVVAPARAIAERRITGEAVLRSGPFGDDVDGARSGPRIESDERSAREVVCVDQREDNDAASFLGDADGRIADVVVRHRDGALGGDPSVPGVQHEERDARLD